MATQVLIGAALCSIAGLLLWWALFTGRRATRAKESLRAMDTITGSTYRELALAPSATQRMGTPVKEAILERVHRATPAGLVRSIQSRIDRAGAQDRWTVERLLAAKILCGGATFVVVMLMALAAGSAFWTMAAFVLGIAGFLLPDGILDHRADDRQARLQDDMPDVIDQLTVSVQAGLGFDAALARVAGTGDGPFAAELDRVVQDIRLGRSRADALRLLAGRTDLPEIDQFVIALTQAELYGLSIAHVLGVQADEQREKRRQRAEERARKIPVKMVVPLIFCIFPTIFIAALGPAVIRAINFDYGI
jgi:tight adherence protein C